MTRKDQNKISDAKIESNVNQYKADRLNAEISTFSSGDLNKYEFLKRIDLNYKPNALDKTRFEFSPLDRAFNEGLDKTISNYQEEGVIKLLKEIRDNLAGGINIPAGLVIPPGPQGPPGPSGPQGPQGPPPPSPSLTNITTPSPSPSSSLTNITPLGPKKSRIPRSSSSQSDFDLDKLLDQYSSQKRSLNKLLDERRSQPNFDADQLRSQDSIPAEDEEPVPLPKLKNISNMEWFDERSFRTLMSPQVPIPRIDQYDNKNKEPSKITKPSKSLKPLGIGAGEWARYAIKEENIKTNKEYIRYLESKLTDMDFSSKEALETSNQIERMKNEIPKLEQELREYYEGLIKRDREYRMSRK